MQLPGFVLEFFGHDIADEYFFLYVHRNNIEMGRHAGIAAMIIVLLTMIDTMLTGRTPLSSTKIAVYILFALMSLGVTLMSEHARRLRHVWKPFITYLSAYLMAGASYGIYTSLMEASERNPMLAFLTCMVAATCIFVVPPVASCLISVSAFVAFRLLGESTGIFTSSSIFHYWVAWTVVTVTAVLRYHQSLSYAAYEQSLQFASTTDELTGLKNRWALRTEIQNYIGQPVFVGMCDFDDFKDFNDRYGHVVGDELLYAFGEALREAFPEAVCYRYGGDEFLVIMPCSEQREFLACARRLSKGVSIPSSETNDIRVHGSVSMGYAWGTPQDLQAMHSLMGLADSQLYLVKRQGKGGCSGEEMSLPAAG